MLKAHLLRIVPSWVATFRLSTLSQAERGFLLTLELQYSVMALSHHGDTAPTTHFKAQVAMMMMMMMTVKVVQATPVYFWSIGELEHPLMNLFLKAQNQLP